MSSNGARPASVIWFERLWLLSLAVWTIVQATTWRYREAQLAANPVVDLSAVMSAGAVAVAAITILLWYFAARRASRTARWGVVAMAICSGAVLLLFGLVAMASDAGPPLWVKALSVASSALTVAAAFMLFRDDARAWFAPEGEMDE